MIEPSIKDLFYQDDFASLLRLTMDANPPSLLLTELSYVLAALTFVGRTEEAETLFQHHAPRMDPLDRVSSRFYLAIAHARHYHEQRSRELLIENFKERHLAKGSRALFFVFQGLAFYRYTYGYAKKAEKLAGLSHKHALLSSYLHGRLLAEDLRAHIEFQLGEVRQGLFRLERLRDLAMNHALKGTVEWASISLFLYKAQNGLLGASAIQALEEFRHPSRDLDNYSQAQVLIEQAAQWMFRGSLAKAETVLEEANQLVFQVGNPRLEALLYVRFALLERMRGNFSAALRFVLLAEERLPRFIDKKLEQRIRGFQKSLGFEHTLQGLKSLGQNPVYPGDRIDSRAIGTNLYPPGQDPFGDFLDLLRDKDEAAFSAILKNQWYAYLYEWTEIPRTKSVLSLDLDGKGSLTTFARGEVEHQPKALTPLLRKLFSELKKGECSKEQILKAVWGYENFHPARHNNLIYNLLAVARKVLGDKGDWIISGEEGYGLAPGVELIIARREKESGDPDARLTEALSLFAKGTPFAMNEYKERAGVSDATAVRDLRKLVELGRVTRSGKGRSTAYQFL